jgi:hypothetical protein
MRVNCETILTSQHVIGLMLLTRMTTNDELPQCALMAECGGSICSFDQHLFG